MIVKFYTIKGCRANLVYQEFIYHSFLINLKLIKKKG